MAKATLETSPEKAKEVREELLNNGASYIFDKEKYPGKWSEYRNKLAIFSTAELFWLHRGMSYLSSYMGYIGDLAKLVGPGPLLKEAKAALDELRKDA